MPEVIIIGAGLAGLCCARQLVRAGIETVIWEASDAPGGRVRTDTQDGFLVDRGFQVLLTAYPECQRVLDYGALDLKPFYPGALVRFEGAFHRVADPFRAPSSAIPTLFSPVGSLADKFRIARLRASLAQYSIAQLFERREITTRERLALEGFSAAMIDRFFRPFFGGIFLEPELRTSSRAFDFIFRMFSDGDIAIPAHGMSAIPEQIAASLPRGTIECNRRVSELPVGQARAVVIATDEPEAARLLGVETRRGSRGVWCYYFAAEAAPSDENVLFLNGDGTGPINNCCVLTNISASYGPPGAALISVTVLETVTTHSPEIVQGQLSQWFGSSAASWKLLRRSFIAYAQPEQAPPALNPAQRSTRIADGVYVCGDHRDDASINGAMVSGRRTAELILEDFGYDPLVIN